MAHQKHLDIIKQGSKAWNSWREEIDRDENVIFSADLRGADLQNHDLSEANFSGTDLSKADLRDSDVSRTSFRGADLTGANLSRLDLRTAGLKDSVLIDADLTGADLRDLDLSGGLMLLDGARLWLARLEGANLSGASLEKADLTRAILYGANLSDSHLTDANLSYAELRGANLARAFLIGADLTEADLSGADLTGADLCRADLVDTKLIGATLPGANLRKAVFVRVDLTDADLTGCKVFGTSAWGLKLDGTKQNKLVITDDGEPVVEVDDLDVAQFIYLILNNQKIRDVIDTVGQKGVLILGRFSPPDRKQVLDAIADQLRQRGFLPLMFDFERSKERDITETIQILAGLSLFVIADMTNPRSNPLELQATVPNYMIPMVPIILAGEPPFAMFADLQNKYSWVLDVLEYDTRENLMAVLDDLVIAPALSKHDELVGLRAQVVRKSSAADYLKRRNADG